MTEKLRITGGDWRGRKLYSPPKNSIRPASDLIRQAVFNMLANHVVDSAFYDVFAGTGIVGLEALSRGAGNAVFVERDRRMAALIRRNLERIGHGNLGTMVISDAHLWARHFVPPDQPTIVFLGPPYPDFLENESAMMEMVERVQQKLRENDFLVLQYPRQSHCVTPIAEHWLRLRHYGKTMIGIWGKTPLITDPYAFPFDDTSDQDSDLNSEEDHDEETFAEEPNAVADNSSNLA